MPGVARFDWKAASRRWLAPSAYRCRRTQAVNPDFAAEPAPYRFRPRSKTSSKRSWVWIRVRRRVRAFAWPPETSFTPPQIAQLYDFPAGDGSGQTIGIIELGGGYTAADFAAYCKQLGVAAPAVTVVSVDGATNAPGGDADVEVMLDVEIAGTIAHGAKLVLYFAPNTDQGFIDAVTTAVHDTTNAPTVISISWGDAESAWTAQTRWTQPAQLQRPSG